MAFRPSSIVILTGAGISAESGVATFRDKGGIWSRVRIEDVATPQAFARDPDRVHDFYNKRRAGLDSVAPNAAHLALARLEQEFAGDFLLVTQNIDDLHERAGSRKLIHMHGELAKALCLHCGQRNAWRDEMDTLTPCPSCSMGGGMRPDVVWFGEMPYQMDRISDRLQAADLFVSIGTSGTVYPAAGFVEEARSAGALTIELNLEPSAGHSHFHRSETGTASALVPAFVDSLLAGTIFNKD
ncbi:NAD-dependent deacylase [Rhizobium sp. EC-SD404]|uniref:NAD-dependent deacylase n=1 Tax=Rhizobium sp. EC-SD404 TaxID=2038389 RepID=UPI00125BBE46|nr:NAD-dependent deacylase [Rhizobium sp. EC-SD404]VVT27297.1 deacetylase of acetyl-CoA synthetase, NAD-dependent [Rhizobium sp. EC-SD404]